MYSYMCFSLAVANCSPMTYRNLPLGCDTCEASVPCRRVREKYFPSTRKQYNIPTTTIAKKPHMNTIFISLRPAQLLALPLAQAYITNFDKNYYNYIYTKK